MTHNEHMKDQSEDFIKYHLYQSPSCPVAAMQLVETFINDLLYDEWFDAKLKVGRPIKISSDKLSERTEYILGVSILDTEIFEVLGLIAAYVGEIIRKNLGGEWESEKGNRIPYLRIGEIKIDVTDDVAKRIFFSPESNLVIYYINLQKRLSQ